MFLKDVIASRKTNGSIPLSDVTAEDSRSFQHSEEEIVTGLSVLQNSSRAPENEGVHAFTEPLQTNQRTKIGRKVPIVMK
jgi:hypothetical protein